MNDPSTRNKMTKMMPGRKLMLTIAQGHEVPWPEPLTDGGFAFPKDYRMNDFPRTPDGDIWYDIPDDAYFSWLADYLPNNLPEFTPEQQYLWDNLDNYTRLSGFWIGDQGGWYESEAAFLPNYDYPDNFSDIGDLSAVKVKDGGYTYDDYMDFNKDAVADGESIMTKEELILDEFGWYLTIIEAERQFSFYWPDFIKMNGGNIVFSTLTERHEPPDAGWRIYLGMVLNRIQDKTLRIKELECFYHYWREMISK